MMNTTTIERPPRTLLEVFQRLPEGTLAQLIENNIVMSPSPLFRHQDILDKIYRSLGDFVENNKLGKTLCAPMDVYFDQRNILQPDIMFISNERLPVIEEDGLHGAPDMIIEILSPSTAKYDMEEKKEVYERCGVKEYWTVDPATKSVQGYFLGKGAFEAIGKDNGIIRSRLLNMEIQF